MEWAMSLSDMEREVVGALIPMFPDVGKEVIKKSVSHPSNRGDPLNNHNLLNRCIDDLLELRTYKDMEIVDLTQDVTQNSPQRYDGSSDAENSLDLTTTITDQSTNLSANETRLTESPVFEVEVSEHFKNQQLSNQHDFQYMDSPDSAYHQPNPSHEDDQRQSSRTPLSDVPQPSNSSASNSSHGFNMQNSFEHEDENHRLITTPSPASLQQRSTPSPIDWQKIDSLIPKDNEVRAMSTPSPASLQQRSTPSPNDWQKLDSPSPKGNEVGSKDEDNRFAISGLSPSIDNDDPTSNASDQRALSTPSPVDWLHLGFPNPRDKKSQATHNDPKEQRQLTTPSPMSVSSEGSGKSDRPFAPLSPMSAASSNSTGGNLTNGDNDPGTSTSEDHAGAVMKSNTNAIDDSGFGSATVSPAVNSQKMPSNTLSLTSKRTPLDTESDTLNYKKLSQFVDLTSPENELYNFKSFANKTSTNVAETGINLFPSSSSSIKAAESPSNESVYNNRFLAMTRGKISAPSTATCACNDCRNGTSGYVHSKICASRLVKVTTAPSTLSRPPPSSSHPENAMVGVSLKSPPSKRGQTFAALAASNARKHMEFLNSSVSSNSAHLGQRVLTHPCAESCGKTVVVPGVNEHHTQMNPNVISTSSIGNSQVQGANEGMLGGVRAARTVPSSDENENSKLNNILKENQRTLNNIQKEFNKLVNGESNRKMRNEVMGSLYEEKAKKDKSNHKEKQAVGGVDKNNTNPASMGFNSNHEHHRASYEPFQRPHLDAQNFQFGNEPTTFPHQFNSGHQQQRDNQQGFVPYHHKHKHHHHHHHRHRHENQHALQGRPQQQQPGIHQPPTVPKRPAAAPNRPAAAVPQAPNRPVVPAPPPAANRPKAAQARNIPPPPAAAPNRPPPPQAAAAPNRPPPPAAAVPNRPPAAAAPNRPPPPPAVGAHVEVAAPPIPIDLRNLQPFGGVLEVVGGDAFVVDGGAAFGAGNGNIVEGDFGQVSEAVIRNITNEVLNLFGDADQEWVRNKARTFIDQGDVVSAVCNDMLENGFPKVNSKTASPAPPKKQTVSKINYLTEYDNASLYVAPNAERQGHRLLQNEFRRLSCYTIGAAMALFNHHYAPTKKCLEELVNNNEAVKKAYNSSKYSRSDERRVQANITVKSHGKEVKKSLRVEVNKGIRGKHFVASQYDPELQKEIDFFNAQVKCDVEERDRQLALELNENQYEEEGQLIECGCCYGDTTFDDMVQCSDGHLFCQTCLQRYIQEATYGEGKAQIVCMTDGCDSIFPRTQLQKALSVGDLAKYDDRVGEESLQLADMGENLVRCPHCNYPALMEEGDKVFQCQAPECKKETCRYCKEDWKDHFGIPCDEIEKKSDTKVRVSYEERMTMAKIRSCHRCKAGFTKSEGCNKMTCRCGAKMCYICRKPNIDYNHFCRHPRDPGHQCKTCSDCSLWSNPEEDDERAVQEIRKQMEDEKKAREKRAAAAGGDNGPDAKKPRTE